MLEDPGDSLEEVLGADPEVAGKKKGKAQGVTAGAATWSGASAEKVGGGDSW